jgi:hypothetical protein
MINTRTLVAPYSAYPPAGEDFSNRQIAAHEIGHGLSLAHNSTDRVALLYQDISGYFHCGTVAPTADEIATMAFLYQPSP